MLFWPWYFLEALVEAAQEIVIDAYWQAEYDRVVREMN